MVVLKSAGTPVLKKTVFSALDIGFDQQGLICYCFSPVTFGVLPTFPAFALRHLNLKCRKYLFSFMQRTTREKPG